MCENSMLNTDLRDIQYFYEVFFLNTPIKFLSHTSTPYHVYVYAYLTDIGPAHNWATHRDMTVSNALSLYENFMVKLRVDTQIKRCS